MKKFVNYLMIILFVPALVLSSCKKDEDEDTDDPTVEKGNYADLKSYMVSNSFDLTDVLVDGWVKPASAVVDSATFTIPGWYVMDIRSATDFGAGHIDGAVNVALGDVLTEAPNAGGQKILVVCKSGQTAGHAVMALRLSGYTDAAVLKFGMAGWHTDFAGPWDSNAGHENGNTGEDHASEWITDDPPALESFATPTWETTATEGSAILAERVELMLSNGFMSISSADIWGNQGNYQIHNFWTEADYTDFGHFSTAFQLKPISLQGDEVNAIDFEEITLVYCFTGQTSSMVAAWLNVMGYDAKSILFGVNKINFDGLETAGKPHWHGAADFDYVSK